MKKTTKNEEKGQKTGKKVKDKRQKSTPKIRAHGHKVEPIFDDN